MSDANKAKEVLTEEKKSSAHSPSNSSELIPAEVQANRRESLNEAHKPLGDGYTVDEEGILNNYAVEPEMYKAKYPSAKQQRGYVLLGGAAILFVAFAVWIAFAAS